MIRRMLTPTALLAVTLLTVGCAGTASDDGRIAPPPPASQAATTEATDSGFTLPPYEKTELANGATVLLMEQHEVPLISVSIMLPGGALADGDQPGLARMCGEAMMFGAGDLSRSELEHKIDFVGARVRSTAGKEFGNLSASFAAKDTDEILPLLADILLRPTFAADEFERYQRRYLAQLTQAKESPDNVVDRYFDKLVYGDHPYATVTSGDAASVAAITVDDVRAFHRNWYRPSGAVISVAGDFSPADMRQRLTDLFGAWSGAPAKPLRVPAMKPHEKARVLLVNKDDSHETTFMIGGPGIDRSNPDYVPVTVVNTILGGRFTSWLNDELRVNAGLTYGAWSYFERFRNGGAFIISSFTPTPTTVEALDLALSTYNRLWDKGIDAKTLASAKAYVKGQFPPRYETASQLAGLLSQMHVYGFDERFINEFEAKVDALTVDETRRIIDSYFPHQNLQFAVIGKADEIRDLVSKYGEIVELEITDPGYDLPN